MLLCNQMSCCATGYGFYFEGVRVKVRVRSCYCNTVPLHKPQDFFSTRDPPLKVLESTVGKGMELLLQYCTLG